MRFHVQALPSREWVTHDLPVDGVSLTRDLSGPSAFTGTVARGFQDAVTAALLPWGCAIYPEQAGQLRGGFIVTDVEPLPDALNLTGVGFAGYPQGMVWTGDYASPDAGVDPLDVVRMVWAHLQDQPDGNLHMQVSDATTPVRLGSKSEFVKFHTAAGDDVEFTAQDRYQLRWWNTTDCGQEIDQLASETPFDYLERHSWDGEQVRHEILLGYPQLGKRRTDLRFVLGENLAAVPQPTTPDTYANQVIGIGAGSGSKTVRATSGRRDGRLRRTRVLAQKDATTARRLQTAADAELKRSLVDELLSEVDVLEHPNASLALLEPGDDIRVQADLGWGRLDQWCRISSVTEQPGTGAAQVRLEAV